jgi:hypothetical protein
MMNFKENEMNWIEEMKAGMQMIKSACEHNDGNDCIEACGYCPFYDYCEGLFEKYEIPSKWNLEEMENKNEY